MSELLESAEVAPESPENEAVTISGAEHLADFRAPELDATGGGEDDVISVDEDGAPIGEDFDGPAAVEMMSKDAFFTVLRHAFGLPGMFMPDFRPLAIQPQEETIARDASDAIYELLEIYYPNALMPQGDTFARIMTAAPFVMAKVLVVREILKSRKQAKLEEQRPARPAANTNAAPAEFSSSRTEPEPPQTEGGRYVAPLNEMAGLDQA